LRAAQSLSQTSRPEIVKGNPALKLTDIEIVFKDGVGYDTEKLIQSVQGLVGIR